MSQKYREGPWPKTRDRECKAHCIYKTALGMCTFKPWPRIFEVRIGLNLRPLARAKLRALRLSLIHGSYREVDARGSISISLSRTS